MEDRVSFGTEEFRRFVRTMTAVLNERDRRIFLGGLAETLGSGNQGRVAEIAGVSAPTVAKGRSEFLGFENGEADIGSDAVRARGGGRKSVEDRDPELVPMIFGILKEEPGASSRRIQAVLRERGKEVSHTTVRRLIALHGGEEREEKIGDISVSGPKNEIN